MVGGGYYGRNRHTQSHEQTESKGKTIFTTLVPSGSPWDSLTRFRFVLQWTAPLLQESRCAKNKKNIWVPIPMDQPVPNLGSYYKKEEKVEEQSLQSIKHQVQSEAPYIGLYILRSSEFSRSLHKQWPSCLQILSQCTYHQLRCHSSGQRMTPWTVEGGKQENYQLTNKERVGDIINHRAACQHYSLLNIN